MAEPTTYIVLREDGDNIWRVSLLAMPAPNAHAAIRKVAGSDGVATSNGTFVAVPARSWKPVTVRAEQQVVLKLEDASA